MDALRAKPSDAHVTLYVQYNHMKKSQNTPNWFWPSKFAQYAAAEAGESRKQNCAPARRKEKKRVQ